MSLRYMILHASNFAFHLGIMPPLFYMYVVTGKQPRTTTIHSPMEGKSIPFAENTSSVPNPKGCNAKSKKDVPPHPTDSTVPSLSKDGKGTDTTMEVEPPKEGCESDQAKGNKTYRKRKQDSLPDDLLDDLSEYYRPTSWKRVRTAGKLSTDLTSEKEPGKGEDSTNNNKQSL